MKKSDESESSLVDIIDEIDLLKDMLLIYSLAHENSANKNLCIYHLTEVLPRHLERLKSMVNAL